MVMIVAVTSGATGKIITSYYDTGFMNRTAEIQYDFNAHRMLYLGFDKSRGPDFTWRAKDSYFTPAAVRRRGIR